MSQPERASRLEQDARRALILKAAIAVFSTRSADEVSTTELAEAAGVSRGLLNHYFRTAIYEEAAAKRHYRDRRTMAQAEPCAGRRRPLLDAARRLHYALVLRPATHWIVF